MLNQGVHLELLPSDGCRRLPLRWEAERAMSLWLLCCLLSRELAVGDELGCLGISWRPSWYNDSNLFTEWNRLVAPLV